MYKKSFILYITLCFPCGKSKLHKETITFKDILLLILQNSSKFSFDYYLINNDLNF